MSENEHEHYTSEETWLDYDSDGIILKNKVPKVLELIPEDVSTIIDVGCGNGVITNILAEKYKVTGIDFSEEALKYVKSETICCSANNIPVADNSFDLVFSSEMLEHLPDETVIGAINEIKRIANKHVLITLPYNEFLDQTSVKCPNCTNIFHAYGHLQTFTKEKLSNLLGDTFILEHFETFGYRRKIYNKQLLKIRHKIGNRYFNPSAFTKCPKCGNQDFPFVKGNLVSKVCNGLNKIFFSTEFYWLVALYSKKMNED